MSYPRHDQHEAMKRVLTSPVAYYYPMLGRICESMKAGLFLSIAMVRSQEAHDSEGWFCQSCERWTEELCLTRTEQQTARRLLRQRGFLHERTAGIPRRLYFRVDLDAIIEAVSAIPQTDHLETNMSPPNQEMPVEDWPSDSRQRSSPFIVK